MQDNSNMFIQQIKLYEEDIQNLKRIINELNLKININNQKDKDINILKISLTEIRKEYLILSNFYESLLADFKININANERLRQLVIDLENKIESHNKSVIGIDISIKQHIEQLTRQSLAKKNIDYRSNKDVVKKMKSDHELIISKIENYTKQNLSFSELLPKYSLDINSSNFISDGNNRNFNSYYSTIMDGKNDNLIDITGYQTTTTTTELENVNENDGRITKK